LGENLSVLAGNYGYTLDQVLSVNPELNDNPALLSPGFKLKLVGWTDDCGEGFRANGNSTPTNGGPVVIPPSTPTVPSPPMPNMIPPPLSTMTPPPMPSAAPAPAPVVTPAPAPVPAPEAELETTENGASKIAATVASVVAAVFLLF